MESLIFFDKSRQYATDTFPHTMWWKCYQSGVAPVVVSTPPARFLLGSCLALWCWRHVSVAVWVFSTVQKHPHPLDSQTNFKSFNFLVSYHEFFFFPFAVCFVISRFFPQEEASFLSTANLCKHNLFYSEIEA